MNKSWSQEMAKMLQEQIISRLLNNKELLEAMKKVPRHLFVSEQHRQQAYMDTPLPIGNGQTISQPYIVALMTNEILNCKRDKALEIGTGCGYQTAILSKIFNQVFTLERIYCLYLEAKNNIRKLALENIHHYFKDGYQGLLTKSPFDAILITCAAPDLPQNLCQQLAIGGKMLLPLGQEKQKLLVVQRISKHQFKKKYLGDVCFVPMLCSLE